MTSFYDLLEEGMTLELGSHTFEPDEIIRFAETFDPQPFHLSEEGAARSNFGRLCASGRHTCSIWMRLNVSHGRDEFLRLTGYEGPPPVFGSSPGLRNIKWLLPVYAGDTITYRTTLTKKKPSGKRDGWAMLLNRSEGFNQDGRQVLTMDGAVLMRMD